MRFLAPLLLLALPVLLGSCGIVRGVTQPAKRTIQSGLRTITEVETPHSPPLHIALKAGSNR